MELQEQNVVLRKLIAGEGKVLISKSLDEKGRPVVKAKEIYLATGASSDDYEEVDDYEDVVEEEEVEINEQ